MPARKYILLPKFRSLTNYYLPRVWCYGFKEFKWRAVAVNTDLKAARAVLTSCFATLTAPYSDFVSLLYQHSYSIYPLLSYSLHARSYNTQLLDCYMS